MDRHKTAIHRTELSRPVRLAVESGLITDASSVFDFGCGHGDDLRALVAQGIECSGWDPAHRPDAEPCPADIVNLGYVVNVIEDACERVQVLHDAWELAGQVLVVSARLTFEQSDERLTPFADGCMTGKGTFQKFYNQHELREWIDSVLGVSSVAAAPGVFFVFRDEGQRQAFQATRLRRRSAVPRQRVSDALYDAHSDALQPLMTFFADRGRLPAAHELPEADQLVDAFGSIRRAFRVVRTVTGDEQWDLIRDERHQDLLVYIALARFGGRPRLSRLPGEMQLDVRALSGTYKRACEDADELLFSAGDMRIISAACDESPVGKATRGALYIHTSALALLPPILRVYEGCAQSYFGHVDGANIIKLNRRRAKVSYLWYPDFEKDPHPALATSLVVALRGLGVTRRDYTASANPPILHRKETLVAADHPSRVKFARLTKQEERWGLLDETRTIGTRERWEALLADKGVRLRGHRLERAK